MKPTPSEYLTMVIFFALGVMVWHFHIPVSYSLEGIGTDMRWASLLFTMEICAIPVAFQLIRVMFRNISSLSAALFTSRDLPTAAGMRAALGDEWNAFKKGLQLLRDWLPLFVFLWSYWLAGSLFAGKLLFPLEDGTLARWDIALFGVHYSVLAQRFYSVPLTAIMDYAYFMHVIIVPFFLGLCYIKGEVQLFRRSIFFLLLSGFVADLGFIFFPAYGPYFYLRSLYTFNLFRQPFVASFVDLTRALHDAFPSLHVALSSGFLLYEYRYAKWLFWTLLPLAVGNWLSTIYLRYHYTVDDLAGFLVAGAAILITEWVFKLSQKRESTNVQG